MAQTGLGLLKYVLAKDSSSHPGPLGTRHEFKSGRVFAIWVRATELKGKWNKGVVSVAIRGLIMASTWTFTLEMVI